MTYISSSEVENYIFTSGEATNEIYIKVFHFMRWNKSPIDKNLNFLFIIYKIVKV